MGASISIRTRFAARLARLTLSCCCRIEVGFGARQGWGQVDLAPSIAPSIVAQRACTYFSFPVVLHSEGTSGTSPINLDCVAWAFNYAESIHFIIASLANANPINNLLPDPTIVAIPIFVHELVCLAAIDTIAID